MRKINKIYINNYRSMMMMESVDRFFHVFVRCEDTRSSVSAITRWAAVPLCTSMDPVYSQPQTLSVHSTFSTWAHPFLYSLLILLYNDDNKFIYIYTYKYMYK